MENLDISAVAPATSGPEGVGQEAESEEPLEEETVDCIEDQMKILRSKNENQREEKLDQA